MNDRVSEASLRFLESWSEDYAGGAEVLPMSFWRSTKVLLPAGQRTSRSGAATELTAVGQLAMLRRFLEMVRLQMASAKSKSNSRMQDTVKGSKRTRACLAMCMKFMLIPIALLCSGRLCGNHHGGFGQDPGPQCAVWHTV